MHGSEEGVATMTEWDLSCVEQRSSSDSEENGRLGDLRERREKEVEIIEGRGGPSRRKHERHNMLTSINKWKSISQIPSVCENPFPHTIEPFPKNNKEQVTPVIRGR